MKVSVIFILCVFFIACENDKKKDKKSSSLIDSPNESIETVKGDISEGKENKEEEKEDNKNDDSISASHITLNASRDYHPSSWNNHTHQATVSAQYLYPSEIEVITGNAGTGWLSLIHNNIKLCYQGNASNNQSEGDRFVLKKFKSNIEVPCHAPAHDMDKVELLNIEKDDVIILSIDGGGCANNCYFTEVIFELELK